MRTCYRSDAGRMQERAKRLTIIEGDSLVGTLALIRSSPRERECRKGGESRSHRQTEGVATAHALDRGIILADTKFEFGFAGGELILIDEVLTPDSSRFWPADRYQAGGSQPSFDKQPLRDYLADLKRQGKWNGEAPPPPLPAEVVSATSDRYRDAYRRITERELE